MHGGKMIQIKIMDAAVREGCRIPCKEKQSIMEALISGGIYVSAVCGGNGTCGKCKIRVLEGELPITPEDSKVFSEEELHKGMRLSCKAYPVTDVTISLEQTKEEEFLVLGSKGGLENRHKGGCREDAVGIPACSGKHYFAIDIGTTTLAISLVHEDGGVVDTYTSINHQRMYGADVISRIQASNEGKGPEMTALIKKDLLTGMQSLLKDHQEVSEVGQVVIACNTTMGHLLMGYDCESLGRVPFTPVNIDKIEIDWQTLFGGLSDQAVDGQILISGIDMTLVPVVILPGFSTYVGGDITSGLLEVGFDRLEKPCLFIDLGTNGEMAIGNKERILVASTAAGPAFEAGNISCGMGSVAGAICAVDLSVELPEVGKSVEAEGAVRFKTLGDKPALGICGTGVIEVTAELLKQELLDETGLLDEEYFDDGFPMGTTPDGKPIVFEQSDIRQLQLAKAAVRGGVETLLLRYGVKAEDIESVYLAGGFGVHLNVEKALIIGLLPEELRGRIEAVGNTSLAGAVAYGWDRTADQRIEHIMACADEVELSADKAFQDFYIEAMMFE